MLPSRTPNGLRIFTLNSGVVLFGRLTGGVTLLYCFLILKGHIHVDDFVELEDEKEEKPDTNCQVNSNIK